MVGGGNADSKQGDSPIRRERLLRVVRRRHQLRLVLLDAPAGFGRTTLLRQAVEEGPSRRTDRDLVMSTSSGDPLSVAATIESALVDADVGPDGHVAVIIDDVHRADDAATLPEIVEGMPERVHLVLSTRLGRLPGGARLASLADVQRLDGRDLAFTPGEMAERADGRGGLPADPELAAWPAVSSLLRTGADDLVVPYLRTEVVDDLEKRTTQVLAALAAVGGGGPGLVDALLAATDSDGSTRAELAKVPLVTLSPQGCWPHPLWSLATSDLADAALLRRAVELAVDDRLARHSPTEAGALAVEGGDGEALRQVVRAALATQPARVPGSALRRWLESGVLEDGAPEAVWLAGVVDAQQGADASAIQQLEQARSAFEQARDQSSEVRVLMHLGALARKTDDLALLGALIQRTGQLAEGGEPDVAGLRAIGLAVTAQLAGDGDRAIAILEKVPERSLGGDWAAQIHMILATNLALAGRDEAAIGSFTRATGIGSTPSQAVANDLLASTLWTAGRFENALDTAEQAEVLAWTAGIPVTVDLVMAARACLLALAGDDDAATQLERVTRRELTDAEAVALAGVAGAISAVQSGDPERAVHRLRDLPPPAARPTRSKLWRAALETTLLPDRVDGWRALAEHDRSLRRAVAAGAAGAAHLRSGTAVPNDAQPFLPSCWWPREHPRVHLRLLGGARVDRDRRVTDVAAWQRGRVRELALHLAVRRTVGRDVVAAALWPDLDAAAANRNLRVTLSHLLDVLDPQRSRGQGSEVIVDTGGRLHLADVVWLRVDVQELERCAEDVTSSAAVGDVSGALAASRRLLRFGDGPLLGGAPASEWLEPVRRHLDELVLRAAETGADLALANGEGGLAAELGRRMVVLDPWSEQAHRMIIAAHLGDGDFDRARRAAADTLRMLGELELAPQAETVELAHRAGWRQPLTLPRSRAASA